jgi:hypothetical protein
MPATTFDAGRSINGSLSGGNLTWTSSASGSVFSSRTITGLTYAEFTIPTLTGVPSVGVVGQNWDGTQMGVNATSVGYLSSGAVKFNGATLATLAAFVAGNRVGVAVDPFNRLIWFRVNGGNWNGSALNDPATGVGGLSFAAPVPIAANTMATFLFGATSTLTGTVWTANLSGAFTDAAPTGFITIDTQQVTAARSTDTYEVFNAVADVVEMVARSDLPTHGRCASIFSPAGTITVVSGITKEGGVAVANKKVEVYDRVSGDLLGTTYSDGSGNWSIPALGRPAVRVVGSDPTTYNSVVFDNVVPV